LVEVEVLGREARAGGPSPGEVASLCRRAAAARGVASGHLAVMFVDAASIARLNDRHRGVEAATDVLSFPVDGTGEAAGPRELGDVVICPEQTADVREAVVHGVLHLLGMDHETDGGEMLALQRQLLSERPQEQS
jgi:probable rRNA maturation factor